MSYPLAGETITRTLRNVEFGHGRARDEPAPPEIAEYFRAWQEAFREMGEDRQEWERDRSRAAWLIYEMTQDYYDRIHNHLRKVLRKHRDHVYTCDGMRFWLHTESHGCRREVLKVEEI